MIPYFIVLGLVVILSLLVERSKSNALLSNIYYFSIFIILLLFGGLRNSTVGADTNGYVRRFQQLTTNSFWEIFDEETSVELGYRILEYFSSILSSEYYSLLLVTIGFALFFQLKGIKLISKNASISIFVFITFGVYTYVFNGTRQAIAGAIFLYAIYYITTGELKKYIACIALAFLFHNSIVLALPLYFLFRRSFTPRLLVLLGLSSILAILFFQTIVDYSGVINERYATYNDIEATGGGTLTISFLLMSSFFIWFRSKVDLSSRKHYDIFLNMFLVGTLAFAIVYFTGAYVEITRSAFYFTLSAIFIWPIIFKNMSNKQIVVPFFAFVSFHIIFFYFSLLKIGYLSPYLLNISL